MNVSRNPRRACALGLLLLLLGAAPAEAVTTLTTGLVYRWGTFFDCFIVNAGTTAIKVTIQAVDSTGTVALDRPSTTVPAGDAVSLEVPPSFGSALLYCKFILTVGNKAYVRASYCVEGGTGDQRCVATGDAY